MSKASLVKSLCLGASVVALAWLALGCGGGGGDIIQGVSPEGSLSGHLTTSMAFEVYVDPASGTVLVNGVGPGGSDGVMGAESPMIPSTFHDPDLWEVGLGVQSGVVLNGVLDARNGYVPVFLQVTNLLGSGNRPAQDIDDVIVVPGNYSGRNTTGNTNAVIPNVLNLQPFGLLNNDLVAQFGNQPIQGDGFTRRTMLWDTDGWWDSPWPEDGKGDPAFSPRDDPLFYYELIGDPAEPEGHGVGQDCWQLVPNVLYDLTEDLGRTGAGFPDSDGIPHDPRLKPFNVDDLGNVESVMRPCSGHKMTVPNCISAVWLGQIAPTDTRQFEMDIRNPTAAAFSFTAVVWASRWRTQILDTNNEGSADYNYNGVSAQNIRKAVAVGESDANDTVTISMTTDGERWERQVVTDDDGNPTRIWANLNQVWLNKTRRVGSVNPVTANLYLNPLPSQVAEEGNFGCAVGVTLQGNRIIMRTLGRDVWRECPDNLMPQDDGMTAQTPLNDIASPMENGFLGPLSRAGTRIHPRNASTVYVAVGDSTGQEVSGAILVSTDCGDTWFMDAPNRRGDRTRNESLGGDLYSAGITTDVNFLSVCADPKPSGVRLQDVQFSLPAFIMNFVGNDPVIQAVWMGFNTIAPLQLNAASPQVANNHRVFVGTQGAEIYYSDDCITPMYTPRFGGVGDDLPLIPGVPPFNAGSGPQPPIPMNVLPPYAPPNQSSWQATWDKAEGAFGSDMILDLECCEITNPEAEFQTDLIVLAVTDNGRLWVSLDGRANPPWAIWRILNPAGAAPAAVTGVLRTPGTGLGPVFVQDTAVQTLAGSSPRPGSGGATDLRGISCNPWDLCPQALNDNDNWFPAATGNALQVWIVGQQSNSSPTFDGIQQPIVLHNPALVSSVPSGWPIPVVADVPYNGATLDPGTGTIGALVEAVGTDHAPSGAPSSLNNGGYWTVQNPRANVVDAVGTLAADLNDVDCVNPLGLKEEFQRIVVPGFPNDKAPVPAVDILPPFGLYNAPPGVPPPPWDTPSDNVQMPIEVPPVVPVPQAPNLIPVERPGWRWIDLDGDGHPDIHEGADWVDADGDDVPDIGEYTDYDGDGKMDESEVFAVVIVPDPHAPLIWPTCWAVGGLPGANQDNGPPGYAVTGQAPNRADPNDAVNLIFPGASENTESHGMIRSYF